MKKFLTEALVFLILLMISFYLIFLKADGKTDPYYLRFTSPKQHSLILGTSRAAQGIQPAILNKELFRNDFYNYAFTFYHSPYGPVYLESIRKKLDPDTHDGIFILSVDPWSISSLSKNPDNPDRFRENMFSVAKTPFVNMKPNILYLINSYKRQFYHLLLRKKSKMVLHNDGWLEVKFKTDPVEIEKYTVRKVKMYRDEYLGNYTFSQVRLESLVETISFLKNHGKVFLVRLPVHPSMMDVDNTLITNFDELMLKISDSTDVPYINLSYMNETVIFTDGNHIHAESGDEVTAELAGKIKPWL